MLNEKEQDEKLRILIAKSKVFRSKFRSVFFPAFLFHSLLKSLQRVWQFAGKLEKVGSLKCH